jgi:potassium-transporting ATPase KdpC subunit
MTSKTTDPTTVTLEHLDSSGGSPITWVLFTAVSVGLFGLIYPIITALIGGLIFPSQANGSLLEQNGRVVGSSLVGQNFTAQKYFIGRPSAAGKGYDPTSLSASNYGPSNPALRQRAEASSQEIAAREGVTPDQIPVELIAASGSGIDPHISLEAAEIQVPRVAKARGLEPQRVQELVRANTQPPTLGVLGMPRVNVLELNLALDAQATR